MKKVRNLQKLIPLLPLLLLAILFIFLPIISMVQKSFLSPETGAFTFNNYKTIFTDSVYQVATSNSLYLSFASTIIGLILSFFIAWAVNELGKRTEPYVIHVEYGIKFCWLTTLFFICSYSWKHRNFVLALRAIGIQLSTVFRLYSIQGLLLMFIYFQLPLGSLMLVPAFQAVDYSWKEAAEILEASPFQFWTRIGIPVMLPSLLDTFALLFANAITAYATVLLVTTSIPLLPVKITTMFTGEMTPQKEMGSALAIWMIIIMLAVICICNLLKKLTYKGGEQV